MNFLKTLYTLSFITFLISCATDPLIEIEEYDMYDKAKEDSINKNEINDSNIYIKNVNEAYDRIHLMLDTKWTPLAAIPNVNSTNGYKKNSTYKGMPYSSTKEIDKYIGFDVSINTFLSAVNNPYSLLYTEDISTRNVSSYGFTYHGDECGPYMGIHCTDFVAYSLGFPLPWITAQYNYLSDIGFLEIVKDRTTSGIKKLDILWTKGHVRLITDIILNEDSSINKILVSESLKNLPRTTSYTKTEIKSLLQKNNQIIYRYSGLNHIPSIVNPLNSIPLKLEYNNDICTYRGDYATFRKGEKIILNYNLKSIGNWSEIELYRYDQLIQTLEIDKNNHGYDITNLNLEYGKYKARLKGDNIFSDYTYFEILETIVTFNNENEEQIITFSSANGTPIYFLYCYDNGWNMGTHIFTETERNQGYARINSLRMLQEEHETADRFFNKKTYLKVFFQGEYGRVTNTPILTDLY